MYTILNNLGIKSFLTRESGALLLTWIIAELFYKFGSFTLETAAFLLTWWAFGFFTSLLAKKFKLKP